MKFYSTLMPNETSNFSLSMDLCFARWNTVNIVTLIIYSLIFILSVTGNSLVILTILKSRTMRNSMTNMYLLNLALADLIVSIICMPPTLVGKLFQCFFFGDIGCKLLQYMQFVAVSASAQTLLVIAFERYCAICRPLQSRAWQTKRRTSVMISSVWILAFAINLLLIL